MPTKTCARCRQDKPESDFYKNKKTKKRVSWCRTCICAYYRERSKQYYLTHKPERAAYYRANRKRILERTRVYTKANPKKIRARYQIRKGPLSRLRRYWKKYRVSYVTICEMFEKQGRCCAICKIPGVITITQQRNIKLLCVDHDHETGLVRGLLCYNCNTGLGHLADSLDRLEKARLYLEDHLANPTSQS